MNQQPQNQFVAVNLGCGSHYRKGWLNFDLYPASDEVVRANIIQGVPLDDGAADFVYHSHVLEHLTRDDGERFLQECYRILKPGGILRIAVPDLEDAAREYLRNIARCESGESGAIHDLEWSHIELYDQIAREDRDGEFGKYLHRENVPNKEYVIQRMGGLAERAFRIIEGDRKAAVGKNGQNYTTKLHRLFAPDFHRNRILRFVLGSRDWKNLQVGRARNAGEVHKWMYDRITLGELLKKTGFSQSSVRSSAGSGWPLWPRQNLDQDEKGMAVHANSFYIEAVK
jgi:predicted SAM-dependent methyltransferase